MPRTRTQYHYQHRTLVKLKNYAHRRSGHADCVKTWSWCCSNGRSYRPVVTIVDQCHKLMTSFFHVKLLNTLYLHEQSWLGWREDCLDGLMNPWPIVNRLGDDLPVINSTLKLLMTPLRDIVMELMNTLMIHLEPNDMKCYFFQSRYSQSWSLITVALDHRQSFKSMKSNRWYRRNSKNDCYNLSFHQTTKVLRNNMECHVVFNDDRTMDKLSFMGSIAHTRI